MFARTKTPPPPWVWAVPTTLLALLSHLAWPVDRTTLHLSYDPALASRTAGLIAALVLVAWALAWGRGARADAAGASPSLRRAFAWAALPLLLALPFTSQDAFQYLAHAATWIDFGANPYEVAPAALEGHPYAHLASWPHDRAHYGPVAIFVAGAIHAVSPTPEVALTLMRIVNLLCLGAAFAFARRVRPAEGDERPARSVAWLAICPLVLWEGIGAAHNDAWVAAALLAAVAAAGHRRFVLAGALLAVSVGVKFTTVLMVPAFVVWTWRSAGERRGRALAAGTLGAIAVLAAGLFAFGGPAPLLSALSEAAARATRSPAWALARLGAPMGIPADVFPFLGRLAAVAIAVAVAASVRTAPHFVRACGWTYFAFLALGAAWFQPWYVLPLVPLAAAAGSPRLQRVVATFAVTSFVGLYGPLFTGYSWAPPWQWSMFLLTFVPLGLVVWRALRGSDERLDPRSAAAAPRSPSPRSSTTSRRRSAELLNS